MKDYVYIIFKSRTIPYFMGLVSYHHKIYDNKKQVTCQWPFLKQMCLFPVQRPYECINNNTKILGCHLVWPDNIIVIIYLLTFWISLFKSLISFLATCRIIFAFYGIPLWKNWCEIPDLVRCLHVDLHLRTIFYYRW